MKFFRTKYFTKKLIVILKYNKVKTNKVNGKHIMKLNKF